MCGKHRGGLYVFFNVAVAGHSSICLESPHLGGKGKTIESSRPF